MSQSVQYLKGVGPVRARQLARLDIHTVQQLVHHYPRSYLRRQLVSAKQVPFHRDTVVLTGKVVGAPRLSGGRVKVLTAIIADASGHVKCTWFNQGYLLAKLTPGVELTVAGQYSPQYANLVVEEFSFDQPLATIQPQYNLTAGISNAVMAGIVSTALTKYREQEIFPPDFHNRYNLLPLNKAVHSIHRPESEAAIQQATYSLKFAELFLYQLSFLAWRQQRSKTQGFALQPRAGLIQELAAGFGFEFTGDQIRGMKQIEQDLAQRTPMHRLLQGDVGSGKTAVAAYGLFISALNNKKAVLMAPTEILASQHYNTLLRVAKSLPYSVPVYLLTGNSPTQERKAVDEAMAGPEGAILVGTHALFQGNVNISGLSLVVTDEQHRFGVQQRLAMAEKGDNPHMLVMSATPIPRTMAMTMYGDLDVSNLREKPSGRQWVKTYVVPSSKRRAMYGFIREQIENGRVGYIVCPLVEQSDKVQAHSVDSYQDILKEMVPEIKFGVLHGRLPSQQKNELINALKNGEIALLLSTTVVEVGVDVGNATFIVIENSERFGLAQLHQLRGRVGRRHDQAYCFLVTEGGDTQRLRVLTKTNDGFEIAEADLKIRGSGEFLGQRQHGLNEFRLADIVEDREIVHTSREAAQQALKNLSDQQWHLVAQRVRANIDNLKS